jgi:hypothetical protein
MMASVGRTHYLESLRRSLAVFCMRGAMGRPLCATGMVAALATVLYQHGQALNGTSAWGTCGTNCGGRLADGVNIVEHQFELQFAFRPTPQFHPSLTPHDSHPAARCNPYLLPSNSNKFTQ